MVRKSRTISSTSKTSSGHQKTKQSGHSTSRLLQRQGDTSSGQSLPAVRHAPQTSYRPPLDNNPLSRLSKQIKTGNLESQEPRRLPHFQPQTNYQPFKTLNTKTLLAPIVNAPIAAQQTSGSHTNTVSHDYTKSHDKDVARTLKMPSEYETYIDRMKKTTLNSRSTSFAEKYYSTQDWLNKERGGPITRKYSAAAQSLLQRYRVRQKTFQTDNYTIDNINRTFEYQNRCKDELRSV